MNDKKYNFFCGIDVSKHTLDFTCINNKKDKVFYMKVSNNKKGINTVINHIKKHNIDLNKVLFCCENTGIYTLVLTKLLYENKYNIWVENAVKIIRSQGLTRGKNDIIDSLRIAIYAFRFEDKCTLWKPSTKSMEKIKHLYALRERLQKCINQLKVPQKESLNIIDKKFQKQLTKINEGPLKELKTTLECVNKEIEKNIVEEKELKKNYELIQSVPCIDKVSATYLLISTDNFSKIKTYREGACYAGIAPYEHSSGSSVRGKTRISNMGNKNLKKLLHICSLSVLKQKKGDLYKYFIRKQQEGKHTISILNALRNKLLNRVFACEIMEKSTIHYICKNNINKIRILLFSIKSI